MKVEAVVNGGVTLIITPQNSLDEEILKTLNQQNNVIVEVQGTAALINKPISSGLLVTYMDTNIIDSDTKVDAITKEVDLEKSEEDEKV